MSTTPDALAGRDVVWFSIFDWWYHSHGHSDFQLALQLAKDRRVLFVNSLGMRLPTPGRTPRVLRRVLRKAASTSRFLRRPRADLPGFRVLSPISIPVHGNPRARRLNARVVHGQVRLASRLAGLRDPVWIVTLPTAWDVVRAEDPELLVYNRSDKHSAFAEAPGSTIAELEERLLGRADLVLYVNRPLFDAEHEALGDRAYFLDHGIDTSLFRPGLPEPPELVSLPHPRAGFLGDLRERVVDFELLARVADLLPDVTFVLMGDATSATDALEARPNVRRLPARPHAHVPPFLAALDVALLPYRRTDWVRHINPIKLKEYLAVGLPIVGTDLPAVAPYAEGIAVAGNAEEFARLVREALEEPASSPAAQWRRAAVAESSWEAKTEELLEACRMKLAQVKSDPRARPSNSGAGS